MFNWVDGDGLSVFVKVENWFKKTIYELITI